MLNKKAVTDIVLLIGTVVIAAIIMSLGAARFVMPLLKTEASYTVLDAQLTIDAVYAAPDDMLHKFRIDYPNGWSRTVVWVTDGNKFNEASDCDGSELATSHSWSKSSYGFQASGYADYAECKDKWVSDTSQMQIIKMEKTYNNEKRTSSLRMGKW